MFHPNCTVRCSCFPPARLRRSLRAGLISNLCFTNRIGKAAKCRRTTTRKLVTKVGTRQTLGKRRTIMLRHSRTCVKILVSSLIAGNISRPCHVFASQTRCHVLLQRSGTSVELAPVKCGVKLVSRGECTRFARGGTSMRSLVSFTHQRDVGTTRVGSCLGSMGSRPLARKEGLCSVLVHGGIAFRSLSRTLPGLQGFVSSGGVSTRTVRRTRVRVGCGNCVRHRGFVTRGLRELRGVHVPRSFSFRSVGSLAVRTHRGLAQVHPTAVKRTSQVPKISPTSIGMLLIGFKEWGRGYSARFRIRRFDRRGPLCSRGPRRVIPHKAGLGNHSGRQPF